MTTQGPGNGQRCRLLECPQEIRDIIYDHILLDFPRPSIECLLRRAVSEVNAMLPVRGGVDAIGNDQGEPESNIAPDFQEEAWDILQNPHKIDTNILLTNHQIFAEAKQVILRHGRLVKVFIHDIDISRRLCATELCLIDSKYGSLCVMNHHLHHKNTVLYEAPPHRREFILCARDVGNFCRAIMGDTALIIRPKLGLATRHKLEFTTNFNEGNVVPKYLASTEVHEKTLKPFRKYLRDFSSVSVQGSCVGLDRELATTAAEDMQSQWIPDPDEILTDLDDLYSLSNEWKEKRDYYFTILPIYKAWGLCKCIVRDSKMWAGVQKKAIDRQAFFWKLVSKAHTFLLLQLICWNKFASQLSPHGVYRIYIMQTYEMCLAAAKWFGVPSWSPSPHNEKQMHDYAAKALLAHREKLEMLDSRPLAVGYKAAQRALQLEPDSEEVKDRMRIYDDYKKNAVRNGCFLDFDNDILKINGIAWWSGSRPWSYTIAGIQDGQNVL